MFSIITLPTATSAIAAATEWASPLFTDLVLILLAGVGIVFGGMALRWLMGALVRFGRTVFGGARRGGRGRGGRR